ncbi:helix-turn-helix transcriptional regulator, partial [uncultured Hydrogenophaga sp.]
RRHLGEVVNTFRVSDLAPDPSYSLNLARNLTALRTAGEWSMRALADQAHVSERMLLYLEKGRSNPSLSTVEKLAQALGVQAGSLFGKRPVARQGPEVFIEAVVAQNLVAARKRLMLSQDGLSQQSGVSRAVIAHIERQARNPSLQTLARLADALDLSLETLLSQ